jgi:hypothetical protein
MSTLTAQVHKLVIEAKSSKELAGMVGKDLNLLLNELNPMNDRNKAGLDLLVPAMKASGDLRPLHWIAEQFGCVVLEVPAGVGGLNEVGQEAMTATGKFGEVMRSFQHALEDGKVDAWELQRFIETGQDGVTAMVGFIEVAKAELKRQMANRRARP